jgi:hypothetical protein
MKYGSSDFTVFLVDGYDLLPAKVQTFTEKMEALQERYDGLGDTREAMSPTGLSKLTIAQTGAFFDDRAHGMHELFSTLPNVTRSMMYSFTGGKTASVATGVFAESYAVVAQQGRLTRANVTYQVSGAIAPNGALIQPLATHTAQWNGDPGLVRDLGPLGAPNGGVVTVQVTALTGIAAITPQLVDSADGVSFAVVTSLTPITTAPSVGSKTVGAVRRYVAFRCTFPETTGSVTLAASFSPNP